MDLFDEEILKPKKKKTVKASTIITIAIALLSILCVVAVVMIVYLKGTILTITVNGNNAEDLEEILIMEENDKVYIPIIRMAKYLKYEAYNGDYITLSEDDTTKCYIETGEELVSFTLNSNILTKVIDGQTQQVKITEPIKEINQELCITSECLKDAFNMKFYYNTSKKQINIWTLEYLYSLAYNNAIDSGYATIEEETFENASAVLDDMIIVKNENNYYGVITTGGATVLETKYDGIQYLRKTSEFLVESNGKKGVISKERKTKVELIYDSIVRVNNKNDIFYVVEKEGLFGLLDENGKIIIYPEYDQIGVDVSPYSQNGITNGYMLHNKLVPVRRNEKWGLFDLEGKKVADLVYDSFGCPNGKNNLFRTYGVLEVPDYNLIVGYQNGKYNLINSEGKWLFEQFILDSVYITVSEGKNIYYISSGEQTKELINLLQENGITKATQLNN